jgi:hypothetical protein
MIEILFVVVLFAGVWTFALRAEQAQRVALLAGHLGRYRIEKRMESLTEGYLRAVGDTQAHGRDLLWEQLALTEQQLLADLTQLHAGLAEVWGEKLRVSRLPVAIPRATLLFPVATFGLREALAIHLQGLTQGVLNTKGLSARDRAFVLTAEMLLLQHTCLWFCRTLPRASAHLAFRHQTRYAQVVQSVSEETRKAYTELVGHRLTQARL